MENALVDMYENPEWTHFMSRLFTDFYKEEYSRAWEESGGNIDLFVIYSDIGSQRGPLISLDMFKMFVAPYLEELVATIHHLGGRALYHSCGDVSMFIPDIIKIGADILDPIQPVTENMFPENLAKYKDSICFHGGIDVQNLLPSATAEMIRAYVKRCGDALCPSYILAPTHYFQPDIPPENIIAV
jgi:uroporphyrinogen decarboxylase